MKFLLLSLLFIRSIVAQEMIELKIPNSNKIVIKLMFFNGSKSDPKEKEGLTFATASLITQGGTGESAHGETSQSGLHSKTRAQ